MNQTHFAMSTQNKLNQLPLNGIKKKTDPKTVLEKMKHAPLSVLVTQMRQHEITCSRMFGASMVPDCVHGTSCQKFLCQKIRDVHVTLSSSSKLTLREIVMQTFVLRAAIEPHATDVLKARFLRLVQQGLQLI